MAKTAWVLVVIGVVALSPACSQVCKVGDTGEACEGPDDLGGAAEGGCQSIDNAEVSLQQYVQFTPAEKRNNPEAGEPEYVYLAAGREAVVIDGPTVTTAGPLQLIGPAIFPVNQGTYSAAGFNVVANETLGYAITIDDFEDEVTIARVELCDVGGSVHSRFIFAASPDGDGVAHALRITPFASGVSQAPTDPVTIEVR